MAYADEFPKVMARMYCLRIVRKSHIGGMHIWSPLDVKEKEWLFIVKRKRLCELFGQLMLNNYIHLVSEATHVHKLESHWFGDQTHRAFETDYYWWPATAEEIEKLFDNCVKMT